MLSLGLQVNLGSSCPLIPVYGTLMSTYCSAYDLIGVYADGLGGTYTSTFEASSAACGYTPPLPPNYGTLITTYCSGYDLYGTYADGSGGTYDSIIEFSSTSCGYSP